MDNLYSMNNENAVLLLSEERYPNGANCPTIHKEYLCPCGRGKIIEERVPGFDDWYARLDCITCQEKYMLIEWQGHIWELKEK